MEDEPYAEKMYLLSASEYSEFSKLKDQQSERPSDNSSQLPPPPPPPPSYPPPHTSEPSYHNSSQTPGEETGEGKKKYSELDIKNFNQNFLTRQNIERFLENEKWNKILDRIKPLLNTGEKKSEIGTLVTPPSFDEVPLPPPLSREEEEKRNREEILKSHLREEPLVPTQTETSRQGEIIRQRIERQKKNKERLELQAKRNQLKQFDQDRKTKSTKKNPATESKSLPLTLPSPSPLPSQSSKSDAPFGEYLAQKEKDFRNKVLADLNSSFKTPPKNSPRTLSTASPYGPSQSTRNQKSARRRLTDDEEEGATGPSGEGFKRFRGWTKF